MVQITTYGVSLTFPKVPGGGGGGGGGGVSVTTDFLVVQLVQSPKHEIKGMNPVVACALVLYIGHT